jgi:hypothetical protein
MKLKDKKTWDKYVAKNTEPYSKACVDVARQVMKLLDSDPTPLPLKQKTQQDSI